MGHPASLVISTLQSCYDSGNTEEGAAEKIMRVRISKGLFVVKRSLVEMAAYTRLEQ